MNLGILFFISLFVYTGTSHALPIRTTLALEELSIEIQGHQKDEGLTASSRRSTLSNLSGRILSQKNNQWLPITINPEWSFETLNRLCDEVTDGEAPYAMATPIDGAQPPITPTSLVIELNDSEFGDGLLRSAIVTKAKSPYHYKSLVCDSQSPQALY